jgi:hypothetical protein
MILIFSYRDLLNQRAFYTADLILQQDFFVFRQIFLGHERSAKRLICGLGQGDTKCEIALRFYLIVFVTVIEDAADKSN